MDSNAFFDSLISALSAADIHVILSPYEDILVANGPRQAYITFSGFEIRTKMLMQVADVVVFSDERHGPGGLANAVKAVLEACQGIAVIDGTAEAEPTQSYLRHIVTLREDPRASAS